MTFFPLGRQLPNKTRYDFSRPLLLAKASGKIATQGRSNYHGTNPSFQEKQGHEKKDGFKADMTEITARRHKKKVAFNKLRRADRDCETAANQRHGGVLGSSISASCVSLQTG